MSFSEFHLRPNDLVVLGWIVFSSGLTFVTFAWDKYRAASSGWRVPEFQLVMLAALGGWPGGLLAMLLLRHKTAKPSFKLKYFAALLVWGGLVYGWIAFRNTGGQS